MGGFLEGISSNGEGAAESAEGAKVNTLSVQHMLFDLFTGNGRPSGGASAAPSDVPTMPMGGETHERRRLREQQQEGMAA